MIREVAPASIALPLPDHPGETLVLRVALIRDLRRHIPVVPTKEEADLPSRWDADLDRDERTWWQDGWKAIPAPAIPTTPKLIPFVTTAPNIDAIELAQTYSHRWPAQENIIKDFLLPLGLEIVCAQMTKTRMFAVGGGRDHVADLDLFIGDDHAVDEQFDQLAFVFKAGLL